QFLDRDPERLRQGFSWSEMLYSGGTAALAAPGVIAAPWMAVPLASGGGIWSAGEQAAQGNWGTASLDAAASMLPWGSRTVRAAVSNRLSLPQALQVTQLVNEGYRLPSAINFIRKGGPRGLADEINFGRAGRVVPDEINFGRAG